MRTAFSYAGPSAVARKCARTGPLLADQRDADKYSQDKMLLYLVCILGYLAALEQLALVSRTKRHSLCHLPPLSHTHTHTHTGSSQVFKNFDRTLYINRVVRHLCEFGNQRNVTKSPVHKAIFMKSNCSQLYCL